MEKLISKLHPLERKVLPVLLKETELSKIVESSGLKEVEVMRALQWLENKEALTIEKKSVKLVVLDKNGAKYKKEGLPENKFLDSLTNKWLTVSEVAKLAKLTEQEVQVCIGLLKRRLAVDVQKSIRGLEVRLGPKKIKFDAESFLKKDFPLDYNKLNSTDLDVLNDLKRRKEFVRIEDKKLFNVNLTSLGKKLAKADFSVEVINRLTQRMLKEGSWKNKNFRAYDVEINVPKIFTGKQHFVNEAVNYIKRIWLDLGFKEMTGDYVESAFWCMDSLFVPQDHPAREMQDTFYLDGKAKLPAFWEKIKKVHEDGSDTGSIGWKYKFSKKESEILMLRTHTTGLSAMTLTKLKKEDLPAKFFAVGKVFRNEALDWKHLFEFYQVEGIVVDPDANFQHLIGYLKTFYKKMGYDKIRVRPAFFPYTSQSLEVDVFHPIKKEWVELGGAGILRPEVTKPLLGFECPVLAWGQGLGRIISEYWNITDIRDLYRNDLKQIREMKTWLK